MNPKGKYLAICGVVLQFGPVFGILGTILGMVRAFGRLAESGPDSSAALAEDIGLALNTTAVGYALALVGMLLISLALFRTRYRAPWFLTALWILSVFWLLSFPIGTILGLVVLVYLINHRTEFAKQPAPPDPPAPVPGD